MTENGGTFASLWPQLSSLLLLSAIIVGMAALIVGGIVTIVLSRRAAAATVPAAVTTGGGPVGGTAGSTAGSAGAATEPAAGAYYAEPPQRRFLRISFAVLWILDALLQAQPRMPAAFPTSVLEDSAASGPGFLRGIVDVATRVWVAHPVVADAVTVWVQLGLGIALLIGGYGRIVRLASAASIVWALIIWLFGEAAGAFGGAGTGWLTGAPGAALCYAVAGALLLLPWSWWDGRAQRWLRGSVVGWLLIGALLQILPASQYWTSEGASAPFADGADMSQPEFLRAPIAGVRDFAAAHPITLNAVVVALLVGCAVWLLVRPGAEATIATVVLCLFTWWLAQDFGVLGGTATDPNTGLALAALAATLLVAPAEQPAAIPPPSPARRGVRASAVAAAVALGVLAPLAVIPALSGPPDSAAIIANSSGGVLNLPSRPAPGFTLTDQRGDTVSLSDLRGKVVVLAFLDPVCTTDCPVIGAQIAEANRLLGPDSGQVVFVAIDVNTMFHNVEDVAAYSESHGLAQLDNWHFLCGSQGEVESAISGYGLTTVAPTIGMVAHSEGMYFIRPDGREAYYIEDGANADLTATYAQTIADTARRSLQ